MSSFEAHSGTRGGWQPRTGGPIGRWLTKQAIKQVRRKGKVPGLGFDALVLTTVGRKSGLVRTTPVGYFRDGNNWLIVASAAGARKNPAWYHNVAANPDKVEIETAGQKVAVIAAQLHGPERDEAWRQITTAAPRFEKYRQKTDRVLPIIRLVPRQE